jgi:hypothetical protein
LRIGRGRGVLNRRDGPESELDSDVEITEAFLLRAANVAGKEGSGEGLECSIFSIQGPRYTQEGVEDEAD